MLAQASCTIMNVSRKPPTVPVVVVINSIQAHMGQPSGEEIRELCHTVKTQQ